MNCHAVERISGVMTATITIRESLYQVLDMKELPVRHPVLYFLWIPHSEIMHNRDEKTIAVLVLVELSIEFLLKGSETGDAVTDDVPMHLSQQRSVS